MAQETGISDGSAPYGGWPAGTPVTARKKKRRGNRKVIKTPPISITSLTDMVTMLLVYLLTTFATNPVEVKEPSIELPRSACAPDEKLVDPSVPPPDGCGPIEETTIVMVTGPQVTRTVNGVQRVESVVPRIVVDGTPVAELDARSYRIPDAVKDPQSGNYVVIPLREALKKARQIKEVTAQVTGQKFVGKVIILADRQTP
jgi:hypothetical protein